MSVRWLSPPNIRAAWWALRSVRRARRSVGRKPLERAPLPPVPAVPPSAKRGVDAVLRRRSDTCLVRAMVYQAWFAANGDERDLIIGVTAPGNGFRAHAWLDGDPPHEYAEYEELLRRPVR
jgi:hypothetical protein